GRREVWALAESAWKTAGYEWPELTVEDVWGMAIHSRIILGMKKTTPHAARLWRILISESAHLIWRLGCERVIGHDDDPEWQHSKESVTAKWYINRPMRQDAMATSSRFGGVTLNKTLILKAWSDVLGDKLGLPEDWTKVRWVLVGMDPEIARVLFPGGRAPH
ncbi:hypothetical protein FOMPIDRAFT_1116580, partial [Fomitopsis schrenkii]